jgi:hypothetical protein
MYHWFVLLEITVVKVMNNLNACSAHSYLYPLFRFKSVILVFNLSCNHSMLLSSTYYMDVLWCLMTLSIFLLYHDGPNIWQAWSLVFLPTKLSVLLKIIFFISLKTTKITSKIQIYEICDL